MLFHSLYSALQHYFITHSPTLQFTHLLTSVGNKQKENCCSASHMWPYTVISVHPGVWTVIFDIKPVCVCSFDFVFFPVNLLALGFSIYKVREEGFRSTYLLTLVPPLLSGVLFILRTNSHWQNTLWIIHGSAPRLHFPKTIFSLSAWHFMGLTTLYQFKVWFLEAFP